MSSSSLKYLEMQRKLYNNFYSKPEIDFENFSNKSNNKLCECINKNKSYNILTSSNKVHDKYLDNLKERCVGGVGICIFSSEATVYSGVVSGSAIFEKVSNTPVGLWSPTETYKVFFLTSNFLPYDIAIAVFIAIIVIVIFLYVYLRNRRKHSCKYECKKHLCR